MTTFWARYESQPTPEEDHATKQMLPLCAKDPVAAPNPGGQPDADRHTREPSQPVASAAKLQRQHEFVLRLCSFSYELSSEIGLVTRIPDGERSRLESTPQPRRSFVKQAPTLV